MTAAAADAFLPPARPSQPPPSFPPPSLVCLFDICLYLGFILYPQLLLLALLLWGRLLFLFALCHERALGRRALFLQVEITMRAVGGNELVALHFHVAFEVVDGGTTISSILFPFIVIRGIFFSSEIYSDLKNSDLKKIEEPVSQNMI